MRTCHLSPRQQYRKHVSGEWETGRSASTRGSPQMSSLQTHLEGEGSQGGNGDQCGHKEGCDIADGREGHTGSRTLEAFSSPVLRMRNHSAENCTAQGPPRSQIVPAVQIHDSETTGSLSR